MNGSELPYRRLRSKDYLEDCLGHLLKDLTWLHAKKESAVLPGLEEYSRDVTQNEFFKNRPLQDAIIRHLEIIGEAEKNLPVPFRSKYTEIPWKQMAGIRDILIHEYFDIDLTLTRKVVKVEIPAIKKSLSSILVR